MSTIVDPVSRWRARDLAALVPGTNAYAWITKLAPQLNILALVGDQWNLAT
jgi:hypothetical protein